MKGRKSKVFAYIKGNLVEKLNHCVVVETMGIGYKIFMSETAIAGIGEVGDNVKVHTHYHVREDDISLYGFLSNDELKMFELLLSVSGIGAKSAIAMLSHMSPSEFAMSIITNNLSKLTKIPGIGPKSAQRIVLELKDKLKTEQAISKTEEVSEVFRTNENTEEAISALQILGYHRKEIEKVLEKFDYQAMGVEDIIRNGLKYLGK